MQKGRSLDGKSLTSGKNYTKIEVIFVEMLIVEMGTIQLGEEIRVEKGRGFCVERKEFRWVMLAQWIGLEKEIFVLVERIGVEMGERNMERKPLAATRKIAANWPIILITQGVGQRSPALSFLHRGPGFSCLYSSLGLCFLQSSPALSFRQGSPALSFLQKSPARSFFHTETWPTASST